jgi:ABC-type uncharacterized transport system substrate-binding protein
MKSFSRGIIALLMVSAILLFSDLHNRNAKKETPAQKISIKGVKVKLAMVHYVDSPNTEDCEKGIRKALADNSLKENIDFTLKVFNAQGDMSVLNSIAGTIGNESWNLVFATSTPTMQILSKKLAGQKIVFTNVGDPIIAGLGKSFDDHISNICGVTTMSDFDGLMALALYLKPGLKRVGTVFTPAEINSVIYKDRLSVAAQLKGIKLIAVPAGTTSEVLDAAKALVAQRIEAFCQISDNLTGSCGSAIMKVSAENKVPVFGFVTNQLKQGAVAICARDYYQAGYEAGQMGVEVLAGKNPALIPFHCVSKTDYKINREAAKIFSIQVPDNISKVFPQIKFSLQ